MTSEDYMGTYEWDHEIDIIIQDMRERLYDLKDRFVTEEVLYTTEEDVYTGAFRKIEELRDGINTLYPTEEAPMSEYKDVEDYRDFKDVKNPNG